MARFSLTKYNKEDKLHVANIFIEVLANKENAKRLIDLHKHTTFTDIESNTAFEECLKQISSKLTMAEKDYYGSLHNKNYGDYSTKHKQKKIYIDIKNADEGTNPNYCGCIGRDSLEESADIIYVCLNSTLNKIFIVTRYELREALAAGEHAVKFRKSPDGSEYLGYLNYSKILNNDNSYEYQLDER